MADNVGGIFGKGGAAEQLLIWQVFGQVIGTALAPPLELLTREINKALPATPLAPADLADMVVRNILDAASATDYARESGIAPADFTRLIQSAGEAPSPEELVTALRRGVIPHDGTGPSAISFEQGIAEGRLYNKWRPVIEALANVPIGVADAVDAVVKNQISLADGTHFAFLGGVSAQDFQTLINTRGNPPAPGELNVLYNRGLIPLEGTGPDVLSVEQGISEGATKNKWWRVLSELGVYIPPPRTVVSLVKEGTVSDEQALALFKDAGLTADLAQKYLDSAHTQKVATHKDISVNELRSAARRGFLHGQLSEAQYRSTLAQVAVPQAAIDLDVQAISLEKSLGTHTFSLAEIKKLRQGGELDDTQALQRLIQAGWNEVDAQTQIGEWNNESAIGHSGFSESRILSYLVSGVLTQTEAYDKLVGNGINSDNARFLVEHPEAGPVAKPHGNTAADIIAAYKDDILTLTDAQAKLEAIGDTTDAAQLKLQVANVAKNRGPKVKAPGKLLSEAHIIDAFKAGLATDTWAQRELGLLGYSDASAALIIAIEETKLNGSVPSTWTVLT